MTSQPQAAKSWCLRCHMWNAPRVTPGIRGKKFSMGPSVLRSARYPGWCLHAVGERGDVCVSAVTSGGATGWRDALHGVEAPAELEGGLEHEEHEERREGGEVERRVDGGHRVRRRTDDSQATVHRARPGSTGTERRKGGSEARREALFLAWNISNRHWRRPLPERRQPKSPRLGWRCDSVRFEAPGS
jgi:hypothetical protein